MSAPRPTTGDLKLLDSEQSHRRARTPKRTVRIGKLLVAAGSAAAIVASMLSFVPATPAAANTYEYNNYQAASAAHAHGVQVYLRGLGDDVASLISARSANQGAAIWSDYEKADLTEFTAAGIGVGELLGLQTANINLIGTTPSTPENPVLFQLGTLGLLGAEAGSPEGAPSYAWFGVLGNQGAIDLDREISGSYDNSVLDLTLLLDQVFNGATEAVLSAAQLEIGALASEAVVRGAALERDYRIADLKLNFESPAVADISTVLETTLSALGTSLQQLLGEDSTLLDLDDLGGFDLPSGGQLNLLQTLGVNLSGTQVSVEGLDEAVAAINDNIINTPIVGANGVTIHLGTEQIEVDLAQLLAESADGINNLDPNSEVLSPEVLTIISSSVTDALGTVIQKVQDSISEILEDVTVKATVDINLSTPEVPGIPAVTLPPLLPGGDPIVVTPAIPAVPAINLVGVTAEVAGPLNVLLDENAVPLANYITITPNGSVLGVLLTVLGIDLTALTGALTQPVLNLVFTALRAAIGNETTVITNPITEAVQPLITIAIDALTPALQLLNQLLSITVNEQPDLKETPTAGDLGNTSKTVRALALSVLPGAIPPPPHPDCTCTPNANAIPGLLKLELASSTTIENAAAEPPDQSVNANASASAAASANADGQQNAAAQVAAQAQADADGSGSTDPRTPPVFGAAPGQVEIDTTPVVFTGSGFVPGETVTITLAGEPSTVIAQVVADVSGEFAWNDGWIAVSERWDVGDEIVFVATGSESADPLTSSVVVIEALAPISDTATNGAAASGAAANASGSGSASPGASSQASGVSGSSALPPTKLLQQTGGGDELLVMGVLSVLLLLLGAAGILLVPSLRRRRMSKSRD